MGNKKAGSESERVLLQNSTGSYMVSLPISMIRELRWQRGQKVTVRKSGEKLIISDWKK